MRFSGRFSATQPIPSSKVLQERQHGGSQVQVSLLTGGREYTVGHQPHRLALPPDSHHSGGVRTLQGSFASIHPHEHLAITLLRHGRDFGHQNVPILGLDEHRFATGPLVVNEPGVTPWGQQFALLVFPGLGNPASNGAWGAPKVEARISLGATGFPHLPGNVTFPVDTSVAQNNYPPVVTNLAGAADDGFP